MNTAFSYIRFSSKEQIHGDSERRQLQATIDYCKSNGLVLSNKSFKDFGISAFKDVARPSLNEMQVAITEGVIRKGDYIILESLDRLSRKGFSHTQSLISSIIDNGVTIVALQENLTIKSTNQDDLVNIIRIALAADLAHSESKKKSERITAAWQNKNKIAKESKRPRTKMIPSWIKLSDDGNSFELDQKRAKTVNLIFTLYSRGMGRRGIASKLNSEKVAHISTHSRTKGVWYPSYIMKILSNEAAIGTFVPTKLTQDGKRIADPMNSIERYYPKAISEELFHSVQTIRKANEKIGGRKGTSMSNILQGSIYCAVCGSTLQYVNTNSQRAEFYVRCSKANIKACTNNRLYRYQVIERCIVEIVGLEHFKKQKSLLNDQSNPIGSIEEKIESNLEQQRAYRKRYDAMFETSSSDYAKGKMRDLDLAIKRLEEEKATLESQKKASRDKNEDYLESLTYEEIANGSLEERVEFNRYLRERVRLTFNPNGYIQVRLLAPKLARFRKQILLTEIIINGTEALFRFNNEFNNSIEITFVECTLGKTIVKKEVLS